MLIQEFEVYAFNLPWCLAIALQRSGKCVGFQLALGAIASVQLLRTDAAINAAERCAKERAK